MDEPCSIVIETLPSLPLKNRSLLPTCPAVYFALSTERTILYIGQTESLYQRWIQHNRMKQLMQFDCALIAWHECSIDQLREQESQCIEHFEPLLNGTHDPLASSTKVSMNLDPTLWQTFRIVAIEQKISASQLITRLIRQEIARWHAAKEPDHAS
jgi:GIY-YIG catalytic domain